MEHGDSHTSKLLLCWRGELGWDGGGVGFEDPGHSRGGRATHPMKELSPASTFSFVHSPI